MSVESTQLVGLGDQNPPLGDLVQSRRRVEGQADVWIVALRLDSSDDSTVVKQQKAQRSSGAYIREVAVRHLDL